LIELKPNVLSTKSVTIDEFLDMGDMWTQGEIPNCSPQACISQWAFYSEEGQIWDFKLSSWLMTEDSFVFFSRMALYVVKPDYGYVFSELPLIEPGMYSENGFLISLENWKAPAKGRYVIIFMFKTDDMDAVIDWWSTTATTLADDAYLVAQGSIPYTEGSIPLWTLEGVSEIEEDMDEIVFQVQPVSVKLGDGLKYNSQGDKIRWDPEAIMEFLLPYEDPDLRLEFSLFDFNKLGEYDSYDIFSLSEPKINSFEATWGGLSYFQLDENFDGNPEGPVRISDFEILSALDARTYNDDYDFNVIIWDCDGETIKEFEYVDYCLLDPLKLWEIQENLETTELDWLCVHGSSVKTKFVLK